jgi:hypothetical protein
MNEKKLASALLIFCFTAATMVASRSQAVTYEVNRSFTDGISTATLTGTVNVIIGNYVIQNANPNPFTAVNLNLTVNATSYNLTNALTDIVFGTGQFFIDATPTTLTFSTANGNGVNPADLIFSDNTNPSSTNRYAIGSNGNPAFEVAYTDAGFVVAGARFPTVFGTAVPEPSSITLFSLAMLWLGLRRRR